MSGAVVGPRLVTRLNVAAAAADAAVAADEAAKAERVTAAAAAAAAATASAAAVAAAAAADALDDDEDSDSDGELFSSTEDNPTALYGSSAFSFSASSSLVRVVGGAIEGQPSAELYAKLDPAAKRLFVNERSRFGEALPHLTTDPGLLVLLFDGRLALPTEVRAYVVYKAALLVYCQSATNSKRRSGTVEVDDVYRFIDQHVYCGTNCFGLRKVSVEQILRQEGNGGCTSLSWILHRLEVLRVPEAYYQQLKWATPVELVPLTRLHTSLSQSPPFTIVIAKQALRSILQDLTSGVSPPGAPCGALGSRVGATSFEMFSDASFCTFSTTGDSCVRLHYVCTCRECPFRLIAEVPVSKRVSSAVVTVRQGHDGACVTDSSLRKGFAVPPAVKEAAVTAADGGASGMEVYAATMIAMEDFNMKYAQDKTNFRVLGRLYPSLQRRAPDLRADFTRHVIVGDEAPCVCGLEYGPGDASGQWVQCPNGKYCRSAFNGWFHWGCVGVRNYAQALAFSLCPACACGGSGSARSAVVQTKVVLSPQVHNHSVLVELQALQQAFPSVSVVAAGEVVSPTAVPSASASADPPLPYAIVLDRSLRAAKSSVGPAGKRGPNYEVLKPLPVFVLKYSNTPGARSASIARTLRWFASASCPSPPILSAAHDVLARAVGAEFANRVILTGNPLEPPE